MPIIIAREGPIEPKVTNPLTPEQKRELWENIVKSYCEKHPEKLQALMEPVPAEQNSEDNIRYRELP